MGVSSIGGIGGYQQQPYVTPLSSGPAAAQRSTSPVESAQEDETERTRRQQEAQAAQSGSSGGNTTATRGQNLNITV
ncbi:hypothetical protein J2848_002146 [Azospirillum lipoferum]|uniref:Uncharacterized protein n=1 Tax=Azospirillum lipoferum TaxID=193 RepID=A0A5A9GRS1_AZOLI|nr:MULTISPECIES: hypothetical protein [Azospirillum]KAA0596485.1 hypothetical protein FZ942_10225 [Azospirillum lipoferum]MCP1610479.1 hypothetical protein [Azospirillum lipoferum]MDW5538076.1 hypothetical protein [Azospirillum sp. NL1]